MSLQSDLHAALTPARQGRYKAAIKAARAGMRRHKSHPAFPNIAATALCALGKEREAVPLFRKALALAPDFHDARRNLAQAYLGLGQPDRAGKLLQRLVTDLPRDDGAWLLLAVASEATGDLPAAETAVGQALALAPRNRAALLRRAALRNRMGLSRGALDDYMAAADLDPADPGVALELAALLMYLTRDDDAIAVLNRAIAVSPDHAGLRAELANRLLAAGDRDRAIATFRAALELAPDDAETLDQLALALPTGDLPALRTRITDALSRTPSGSADHATLMFALAHAGTRAGDAAAMDHLKQANDETAALTPYDAAGEAAFTDTIRARFPAPARVEPVEDTDGPVPIFVLGMPRSGTTLAEAVLGAHDAVVPLGERRVGDLLFPWLQSGRPLDAGDIARIRRTDRANLPDLPEGTSAYVDKMPENHRLAGFLKTIWPEARIIHLRRDPRDTALSLWRARFPAGRLAYAYDRAAMAHRFNLYAGIMAHWRQVMPGNILEITYESLVSDPGATSRELARFCGLDWQSGMAQPDRHAGQVRTLSVHQLRQPVHTRSVGQWRDHADLLAPFIEALDPELWPELADATD
ncbi:tetratricopeptide repeat-containing sulfotransferase family protein [Pukyongiella litopenaei]|uniref:Tetratricopeptide repeat protein n=1 Tax=Pukyongiella litopenaei TaxID=2605946 RepID=A0A2S0MN75_9RHOB|nr:tetratricopeptide repeat-containing sulfotransferase family protein [Pukyongiella litopenaei]AVO37296.1 tetratricopeptide repeat protein [Pukyongiella litopenaei]